MATNKKKAAEGLSWVIQMGRVRPGGWSGGQGVDIIDIFKK